MRLRRDWIEYLVLAVVMIAVAGLVYIRTHPREYKEVEKVKVDDFVVKVPSGFHLISKDEKKAYGISERIVVLAKGDMGHLILIDVEKGIPLKIYRKDLDDYFNITLEELNRNVDGFKLIEKKKDLEQKNYKIVYSGKIKETVFYAAYYSVVVPGKKLNITISVPAEEKNLLFNYVSRISESITFKDQKI